MQRCYRGGAPLFFTSFNWGDLKRFGYPFNAGWAERVIEKSQAQTGSWTQDLQHQWQTLCNRSVTAPPQDPSFNGTVFNPMPSWESAINLMMSMRWTSPMANNTNVVSAVGDVETALAINRQNKVDPLGVIFGLLKHNFNKSFLSKSRPVSRQSWYLSAKWIHQLDKLLTNKRHDLVVTILIKRWVY